MKVLGLITVLFFSINNYGGPRVKENKDGHLLINNRNDTTAVIRNNLLGYPEKGVKVAVWAAKQKPVPKSFSLIRAKDKKVVFTDSVSKDFGAYGPFSHGVRLDFSGFTAPGKYYLKTKTDSRETLSTTFQISDTVYKGTADFSLQYLRQQRSGFNPYLRDSVHTHDGYTVYGPMPKGTYVDVSGGWHDASDYLQYVSTSATADYYLLAAGRDFPKVFTDSVKRNGLPGKNSCIDVLDEARWGLDWLLKMHPRPDWMFNQIADDRDHAGFRLPNKDSVDYGYGPGKGRPVYFLTGKPQGLGKYKNHTEGAASTAGKFAASFALGAQLFRDKDPQFAKTLKEHAFSAYQYGKEKPGFTQTASNVSPYYYTEMDWHDDMELGAALLAQLTGDKKYQKEAYQNAQADPYKRWMAADTMSHYQWYPFYNAGHYELSDLMQTKKRKKLLGYYKKGLEAVWERAQNNAFYRGIPFIWVSNNLTAAFAMQAYLYRKSTGDGSFRKLEQASVDWLLGANPWGTSMVVGLPAEGDYPSDPHSAFWHLKNYQVNGGLVDGPVDKDIFDELKGVHLTKTDRYSPFQSSLAVYHDDYADYSTNEPTTDGTAIMLYLLAAQDAQARFPN